MSAEGIKLSRKYKDFLKYDDAKVEILEGTTASGKTTTGIIKFILKVIESKEKMHIISGKSLGIIEKNIINPELGILDIFGEVIKYYPRGHGGISLPYLSLQKDGFEKAIYIFGYGDSGRWEYVLGGQYGCIYIDEVNTANMDYVRQAFMRCDYLMATLNPDDPDKDIYREYINRCRPIEKYKGTAPEAIENMLDEEPTPGWVWWYFTFNDNKGLTEEKINQKISSYLPGSADYRYYVLGLRGKAEGVIFDNFDRRRHCITEQEAIGFIKDRTKCGEFFIQFSAGLDTSYSKNSNDTIAMSFIGITNKRRIILLDEEVLNNKLLKVPFAPSDIAERFFQFLELNRNKYGFAQHTYIDSADQATITELQKFKARTGSIYNFIPAYKALKILDRITLQKGWLAKDQMLVVDKCKTFISEMSTYSWNTKEGKMGPEDGNDHMVNSVQYAWIPYKTKIGG